MTLYLTALVVILAVFAVAIVMSTNNKWVNALLTFSFAGLLIAGNMIYFNAIGMPKAIKLEFLNRNIKEATVLYAGLVENEGIYLVLEWKGSKVPRFYVMPWDKKKAQELMSAQSEANKNGKRKLKMRMPFKEQSMKQVKQFHPEPQPGQPDKEVPGDWVEIKPKTNNWGAWGRPNEDGPM